MQDTVTSRELFERMPTRPALAEPEVAEVRAAFAAGASGKKKLNKREQKDARGPRPII